MVRVSQGFGLSKARKLPDQNSREFFNPIIYIMVLLIQGYGRNHLKPQPARSVAISVGYTKEQNDLMAHFKNVTMTNDQLAYIEEFCAKISTDLDRADFNTKRQIVELLDIRSKITFEDGQKVV